MCHGWQLIMAILFPELTFRCKWCISYTDGTGYPLFRQRTLGKILSLQYQQAVFTESTF